jgi:hypothetical protein
MPLTLPHFAALRPVLYHLTARSNADRILREREIVCASTLMSRADDRTALRSRRPDAIPLLRAGETTAVLRDQKPLHRGNIALQGGWTFEDFVESLNARVFFWPGDEKGPIKHGLRHFSRYAHEDAVVLRIPTMALFEANPAPKFCRYNSGSPRCSGGRHSPRGPGTFVAADAVDFRRGEVVEVTFESRVVLPQGTETCVDVGGFVAT